MSDADLRDEPMEDRIASTMRAGKEFIGFGSRHAGGEEEEARFGYAGLE